MNTIPAILISFIALVITIPVMAQDLEGEATAQPIDWEPVITSFYLRPRQEGNSPRHLKLDKKEALPGFRAAWLEIKPLIVPRPQGYGPNDPIIGGWKLEKDPNSEGILPLVDQTSAENPVLSMLKDEAAEIVAGFDVIMSNTDQKEQIVDRHFRITELLVTKAIWVSADPKDFRNAVPADAKSDGNFTAIENKSGGNWAGVAWSECALAGKTLSLGETIGRVPGVAEYRIKVTISGRFSLEDQPQIKSAEGAIRVVYLPQGVKVEKLSFEGVKWVKPADKNKPANR